MRTSYGAFREAACKAVVLTTTAMRIRNAIILTTKTLVVVGPTWEVRKYLERDSTWGVRNSRAYQILWLT